MIFASHSPFATKLASFYRRGVPIMWTRHSPPFFRPVAKPGGEEACFSRPTPRSQQSLLRFFGGEYPFRGHGTPRLQPAELARASVFRSNCFRGVICTETASSQGLLFSGQIASEASPAPKLPARKDFRFQVKLLPRRHLHRNCQLVRTSVFTSNCFRGAICTEVASVDIPDCFM